mgnify:CR=1 FL=1
MTIEWVRWTTVRRAHGRRRDHESLWHLRRSGVSRLTKCGRRIPYELNDVIERSATPPADDYTICRRCQ